MERKDFLKNLAAGGSILLVSPALFNACSKGTDQIMNNTNNNNGNSSEIVVDLTSTSYSALSSVGGYAYKSNVIIIRTSDTQYVALSSVCTHQGCTVMYNASTNQLPCPCHGSLYSISGSVINGPAPKSLKKYNTKIDGNNLIIT
ncbi:MAG TPA: ubiquinol-cytochrome c reductase iron-sulfur subunit [Draconibacterium sp.]|nr:ubiquinol-cytochrome c reductase iron-sulfur subunit [Draconibacterium sp.]